MSESINDFREGQWWHLELEKVADQPNAEPDLKRAVAVIRNLLRVIASSPAKDSHEASLRYAEGFTNGHDAGWHACEAHAELQRDIAAQNAPKPALFLSSKQVRPIATGAEQPRSRYLPFSLKREGNFDAPVYLAPEPKEKDDAFHV